MKDEVLEILSIMSIIGGIILGYVCIFDYSLTDAFFISDDDNNVVLEGVILKKDGNSNMTQAELYACRNFIVYFDGIMNKSEGERILLEGTFSKGMFFAETYK